MQKTSAAIAAAILLLSVWLAAVPARAQKLPAEEIVEEPIRIAIAVEGAAVELEGLVVRPSANGRFPLALITHGINRDPTARPNTKATNYAAVARAFALRGYAATVVVRRGFGTSGGSYAEASRGPDCATRDHSAAAQAAAHDLAETIAFMARQPYVDPTRVVSMGTSVGGFANLALGQRRLPNVKAVINFAGGRGSRATDDVCGVDNMTKLVASYGAVTPYPTLWIYAENDSYFNPQLARRFHQAFTGAGGKAELVITPAWREDGHFQFSGGGMANWIVPVDAFLARHGLPSLKMPPMPAAIASAKPAIRTAWSEYLLAPSHKAFVIGRTGGYGWRTGNASTADAVRRAMEACGGQCRVLALNYRVLD